jgi:catechol 2,3-dioxygenase-like lactoylglutathione lyase family enzyme
MAQTEKVLSVGFTVSDMEQSLAFYTQVLPFEKVSDTEVAGEIYEKSEKLFGLRKRIVTLKLGDEKIELTDYLTVGGRPIPVDSKSNDLWFQHIAIVVSDMDSAYNLLKKNKTMQVSTNPQTIPANNKAAAGIKAFYFHDPDGHNLELIYFPPDKGKAKWHNASNRLFLGIDHTAIGISSTEKSLKFYRNLLGLKLGGESFNSGTEQAHLNNVMGASLHISGLKASEGIGIEFLEYLSPGYGRKYPKDSRTDDIWHWNTTIEVKDIRKILTSFKGQGMSYISKEIITLPELNNKKSFLIRDPDGHSIRLVE